MNVPDDFTPFWHDRPVAVALRPDEVHAWLLDLDAPVALDERLLDGAERERAARLKVETDRCYFIRRRLLARGLVAGLLGVSPADIAWTISSRGRPSVNGALLDFNWSHSGNLFLFAATATGRVGADIERWRAELSRRVGFWSEWTAGEAEAKARGTGIVEPDADNALVCRFARRESRGNWSAAVAWL